MTRQSNDMPREKLTRQQIQQMSLAEKQARLVRFICAEEVSEEMLNILLEILEKPVSEKKDQS